MGLQGLGMPVRRPDRLTLGVNLGVVKAEAEWNQPKGLLSVPKLREWKARARIELRSAARRNDSTAVKRWKKELKEIEDELDRLSVYRE
jgi:hypothetical protein